MKNAITFLIIFGLGAVTYALLMHFFTPNVPVDEKGVDRSPTSSLETANENASVLKDQEEKEPERPVVITPDGSLLDGPFVIFDADGKDTGATVEIVRSPEETLIQFKDLQQSYNASTNIYFANDLDATDHFNLGAAHKGSDIYGIPLDADLESYSYILIYDTLLEETLSYAKIK